MRERLPALEHQPENAYSDGMLFAYRDANRQWRLVWRWGYQRSESQIECASQKHTRGRIDVLRYRDQEGSGPVKVECPLILPLTLCILENSRDPAIALSRGFHFSGATSRRNLLQQLVGICFTEAPLKLNRGVFHELFSVLYLQSGNLHHNFDHSKLVLTGTC